MNEVLNLAGPVLADEELDRLRGGFMQDGLEISIGLDQIVALNGQELIVNRLTIPNLNQKMRGRWPTVWKPWCRSCSLMNRRAPGSPWARYRRKWLDHRHPEQPEFHGDPEHPPAQYRTQ